MSKERLRFSWIYKLSADREELSNRGCDIGGDLLHARLLRCELDTPLRSALSSPSQPPHGSIGTFATLS